MQKPSIFARLGLVAGLAFLGSAAFAATATVDGVGGAATVDATFPTSYATVGAALTAVQAAAGDHDIVITTAGPIDEPAGLRFNTAQVITVTGVSAGTVLRINATGIGVSGTTCAVVVAAQAGTGVTLSNLIITPNTGTAGAVAARGLQVYTTATVDATVTLNNTMFTALDVPNSNAVVTNPFVAAYTTKADRRANLRAFSGGGSTGVIEIRNDNSAGPGVLTVNLNRSGVTHSILSADGASGSGLNMSRTANSVVNIGAGSFFTYNESNGIRTVGTMNTTTTAHNLNGTAANPIVIAYNGWQEDSATLGRNEGILIDGPATISHTLVLNNFRIGVIKVGGGTMAIQDSLIAYNQFDLDPSNGTAPNATSSANVRQQGSGPLTITRSTLFDAQQANGGAITWNSAAGSSITTNDVVVAGGSDQVRADNAGGARTFTDINSAFVEAGPVAMASPTILLGTNVTRVTDGFAVTADPDFASTTVSLTWGGLNGSTSVNADAFSVRSTAYRAARAVGAADVKGWNQASPLPVELSTFMLD